MKQTITKDQSSTFFSEEYQEHYHSTSGALEEAQKKFVEPCNLKEGMTLLDIGFGLGYNVAMALHHVHGLKIVSLEKDEVLLSKLSSLPIPSWFKESYDKVLKAAKNLSYKDDHVDIRIVLGDATKTIKELSEVFDVVFLDAFSPKVNPELWTESFFKSLYTRMKPEGILATYSCAGQVRRNLNAAGFLVKDGPIVGRRSPGTLAIKEKTK